MKRNLIILASAVVLGLSISTSCGPLVTSGPDVMVGGGIYPAPVWNPPMGNPFIYRPGAPFGPGYAHGPGSFNRPANRPSYFPGGNPGNNPGNRPGNNNPGFNPPPGNPGPGSNGNSTPRPNPGFNGGNNRQPGTGVGGL